MAEPIWPTKIWIVTINLGKIRYLGVLDITDFKLQFIVQKFKIIDPIWRTNGTIYYKFGWFFEFEIFDILQILIEITVLNICLKRYK